MVDQWKLEIVWPWWNLLCFQSYFNICIRCTADHVVVLIHLNTWNIIQICIIFFIWFKENISEASDSLIAVAFTKLLVLIIFCLKKLELQLYLQLLLLYIHLVSRCIAALDFFIIVVAFYCLFNFLYSFVLYFSATVPF